MAYSAALQTALDKAGVSTVEEWNAAMSQPTAGGVYTQAQIAAGHDPARGVRLVNGQWQVVNVDGTTTHISDAIYAPPEQTHEQLVGADTYVPPGPDVDMTVPSVWNPTPTNYNPDQVGPVIPGALWGGRPSVDHVWQDPDTKQWFTLAEMALRPAVGYDPANITGTPTYEQMGLAPAAGGGGFVDATGTPIAGGIPLTVVRELVGDVVGDALTNSGPEANPGRLQARMTPEVTASIGTADLAVIGGLLLLFLFLKSRGVL